MVRGHAAGTTGAPLADSARVTLRWSQHEGTESMHGPPCEPRGRWAVQAGPAVVAHVRCQLTHCKLDGLRAEGGFRQLPVRRRDLAIEEADAHSERHWAARSALAHDHLAIWCRSFGSSRHLPVGDACGRTQEWVECAAGIFFGAYQETSSSPTGSMLSFSSDPQLYGAASTTGRTSLGFG